MSSLSDYWKRIIRHITLEPAVVFYLLCSSGSNTGATNLMLEKGCRVNLGFNAATCNAMALRNSSGYEPVQETEVQQIVSRWLGYKLIIMGSVPVIWMLFLGSWSDRHNRRKPLILGPTFGQIVGAIGGIICSHFFLELSMEYVWLFYVIPYLVFGAEYCFFLGVFSYVSGLCTDENRTLKIGTVSSCFPIGLSLGNFLSGIILNHFGYKVLFTFSVINGLLAFFYSLLVIREKRRANIEQKEGSKNFFRELFLLEYITDTFRTCFHGGEGNNRNKIIVLIFLIIAIGGANSGEMNIIYLYARLKCGWNEEDFGIFNSVHFCIQMVGTTFSLLFLSKHLKLDDSILGAIAMISKILASLMYAFAPSGIYFYVGAVIEIFFATSWLSLRAIMATAKPPHELGKSNSVFGICEALSSLALGQLYAELYIKTLTIFPGFFLLFTVVCYTVSLFLFIWLYHHRKSHSKTRLEIQESAYVERTLISEYNYDKIHRDVMLAEYNKGDDI